MYINGRWCLSSAGLVADDVNPATGAVFAQVAQASAEDVNAAIAAAHAARTGWAAMLAGEREALLLRAADLFAAHRDALRDLIIQENGSVWIKAPWEVDYAVDCLRSAAGCIRQPHGETFPTTTPGVVSMTIRQPLGVIGGISPFNSPLLLGMKKVAFALAAGNTFVLKPSELTPLVGLKMAEIFEQAGLPPGVLNVVPGDAEVGRLLVSDERVRMITFTGSSKVGRVLAAECGRHFKRVCLEMGGKSPTVVLQDADLDYAVDAAAFGIFFHQGQVCMSNSRIIVEKPLYEAFCEKFVAKARTIRVGDPRSPETVVGPLVRESQAHFIMGQIEDAVGQGASVLTGGTHEGPYFQPTVLTGVTPAMRIYGEESFGPVTSIYCADDFDHAVHLANDTSFGLSSAVVTNDLQRAFEFAHRVESGMVHINDTTIADEPHITFGGVKNSGLGREGGEASMHEMTEVKWVTFQLGKRQFPF
ncbi:aldehyde dehydrogenase family protein [Corticibacter populi]|uniref:Salicylaldehyde dehydrogenase n=2 Tax=Corticibacter populi TaxID=1550736 RepID=A0A3M6QP39_9BURK|nr:aldehyde dehydrogenase family protein [Corticibacter populi]